VSAHAARRSACRLGAAKPARVAVRRARERAGREQCRHVDREIHLASKIDALARSLDLPARVF